jgi:hypothetical protein
MQRTYDVFERFSDGSSLWHACVSGQFEAQRKLQELAEHSENGFFAIDLKTHERVAFLPPQKSPKQIGSHNTRAA